MSGLDDLGRALRDDAAANAPRASAIDVDAVTRAARARRAPRLVGVGALAMVGALSIGGLAIGALAPPVLIAASESADTAADAPAEDAAPEALGGADGGADGGAAEAGAATALDPGPIACGAAAPDVTSDALSLSTGDLDDGGAGDPVLTGTVTLRNEGSATLTLTVPIEATGVLVRDGVVVGEPAVLDAAVRQITLAGGETWTIPVRVSTIDCARGGPLTGALDAIVTITATAAELGSRDGTLVAEPVAVVLP